VTAIAKEHVLILRQRREDIQANDRTHGAVNGLTRRSNQQDNRAVENFHQPAGNNTHNPGRPFLVVENEYWLIEQRALLFQLGQSTLENLVA